MFAEFLICLFAFAQLSHGQLLINGLTEDIQKDFRYGFKRAGSLLQSLNVSNIDEYPVSQLENAILEFETNVLHQVVVNKLLESSLDLRLSGDARVNTFNAFNSIQIKDAMKKLHFVEPNAAKSLAMKLRTRHVPRDLIKSLNNVTDEELKSFLDVVFSELSHSRSRRSVTGAISTVVTVRDVSCHVYNLARSANITRAKVNAFVKARSPRWMQTRVLRGMLNKGLEFVSKLMRLVCNISETKPDLARPVVEQASDEDVEILDRVMESKKRNGGKVKSVVTMTYAQDSYTPFCSLSLLSRKKEVSSQEIEDFIRIHFQDDDKLSSDLLDRVDVHGVRGIQRVSSLACQLTAQPVTFIDNDVVEETNVPMVFPSIAPKTLGRIFCSLWMFAAEEGATRQQVMAFIDRKFPEKWRQRLLGQLALKGIHAVVDIAGEQCGVKRMTVVYNVSDSNDSQVSFNLSNGHHVTSLALWINQAVNSGLDASSHSLEKLRLRFSEFAAETK